MKQQSQLIYDKRSSSGEFGSSKDLWMLFGTVALAIIFAVCLALGIVVGAIMAIKHFIF
jgi:hypothetical protein